MVTSRESVYKSVIPIIKLYVGLNFFFAIYFPEKQYENHDPT